MDNRFLIDTNIIIYFLDDQKNIEMKKKRKMKTPDAIIGATAIVYDLTLVTRNEIDFKHIKEIKIYNPFN